MGRIVPGHPMERTKVGLLWQLFMLAGMYSTPFFMWIGIYRGQTRTNARDGDPTFMAGASLIYFSISCGLMVLLSDPANINADGVLTTLYFLFVILYDAAIFVQAR